MSLSQNSFNLIIAATIITPKYSFFNFISWKSFLHDSIQLKNLSTILFFLYSTGSTFIGLPFFFFFRFLLFTGILDFILLSLLYFLILAVLYIASAVTLEGLLTGLHTDLLILKFLSVGTYPKICFILNHPEFSG